MATNGGKITTEDLRGGERWRVFVGKETGKISERNWGGERERFYSSDKKERMDKTEGGKDLERGGKKRGRICKRKSP